jgi:CDP-glucose 4,6-dehydratase
MNWRDRRVFVTGGTGFLGGRLVKRLRELDAEVICLYRDVSYTHLSELAGNSSHLAHEDVLNQRGIERILGERQIQTVFHLAAQTQVAVSNANPVSTFETNVLGTVSLLEACRRSPRVEQIVVASSDKAYGEGIKDETAPLNAAHPYDVSKACADRIAQTYAATFNMPIAITRCANLFGGGDLNWGRLVPGTIRSLLRGERPVLRGSGRDVRDWLHVSDAVAAYIRLAEWLDANDKMDWENSRHEGDAYGQAFNFSLGVQVSALEVVERIMQVTDYRTTPEVQGKATGEISSQGLLCDKAREILDWWAKMSMNEGLAEAVEWYRGYV